jgi:hypothetical protein
MNQLRSSAAKFAAMPDEDLFGCLTYWEGDADALKTKRDKRTKAKEQLEKEQQRIEQARLERVQQRKEAVEYSDALAQEICERIAVGELLINICLDGHTPSMRRCNQWLRDEPEFQQLYQSAINDRLSVFEEEVIQIADDMARDFRTVIKNGREKRVADPEMVARARLRIEVRFKHLKAGKPAKWGEISTLNVKNQDEFDTSNLSQEDLERQIADIERKSHPSRRTA